MSGHGRGGGDEMKILDDLNCFFGKHFFVYSVAWNNQQKRWGSKSKENVPDGFYVCVNCGERHPKEHMVWDGNSMCFNKEGAVSGHDNQRNNTRNNY